MKKMIKGLVVLFSFLLLVTCGGGGGSNDAPTNHPPVANAGIDQNVFTGGLVLLDGWDSSDADGDFLTYHWAFSSKPGGSVAVLSGPTSANPIFTADIAGVYVLSLIVNDGEVDSSPATVTITASDRPQAKFEIIAVEKTTTTFNSPSLMITVKNTGTATGYNVGCDAHAINAAGTIIDTAQAFFAGLGNITVGQTAQDEAVFFTLISHADYARIEYDCSWLTRN
jgi:hypothetical protein